jgi:hypothetical protein
MYVTIQEATKLTGKSRATITRHISTGKLSKTDKGIDTAELMRVYGALVDTLDTPMSHSTDDSMTTREQWLMSQIDTLQQQLMTQKAEYLERENRLFAMLTHQTEPPKAEPDSPVKSRLFEKLFGKRNY